MRTTGVVRLRSGDESAAADTFTLLATVFGEASEPLPVAHLHDLLEQPGFWVYAAYVDGQVVGGLTAHTLPMTNRVGSELIIYDIAVVEAHQRRGIGAELLRAAAEEAARAGGHNRLRAGRRRGSGRSRLLSRPGLVTGRGDHVQPNPIRT